MSGLVAPKRLSVHAFWGALVDAGLFHASDLVRRIVIDANPDNYAVVMYVEHWGDERLLQVAQTLDGIEIRGVPHE